METKLPGFGLQLHHMSPWQRSEARSSWRRFPHAIADFFATEGVTMREQRMLDFVNQITDKPQWTDKIHNDEIVGRWRAEACGTKRQQQTSSQHMSEKCFDYVRFRVETFELDVQLTGPM